LIETNALTTTPNRQPNSLPRDCTGNLWPLSSLQVPSEDIICSICHPNTVHRVCSRLRFTILIRWTRYQQYWILLIRTGSLQIRFV